MCERRFALDRAVSETNRGEFRNTLKRAKKGKMTEKLNETRKKKNGSEKSVQI